ncbi:MAG: hypothetical protein ACO3X2_10090, partial [Candidatus Nanopelagicales bacterium]
MNKLAAVGLSAALIFVGGAAGAAAPASAAPTKFTSCASMYKYYKYGISKNKKAQKKAVKAGMYK